MTEHITHTFGDFKRQMQNLIIGKFPVRGSFHLRYYTDTHFIGEAPTHTLLGLDKVFTGDGRYFYCNSVRNEPEISMNGVAVVSYRMVPNLLHSLLRPVNNGETQ